MCIITTPPRNASYLRMPWQCKNRYILYTCWWCCMLSFPHFWDAFMYLLLHDRIWYNWMMVMMWSIVPIYIRVDWVSPRWSDHMSQNNTKRSVSRSNEKAPSYNFEYFSNCAHNVMIISQYFWRSHKFYYMCTCVFMMQNILPSTLIYQCVFSLASFMHIYSNILYKIGFWSWIHHCLISIHFVCNNQS